MTTKPTGHAGSAGLAGLTTGLRKGLKRGPENEKSTRRVRQQSPKKQSRAIHSDRTDAPIKLMKVSHAMTLIYIALLLAFSIVAVQNNRIRKAHSELLEAHDALYVEAQILRLEAADITSPIAIRDWAKNQGMVPYYSSEMELEQLEPSYLSQQTTVQTTAQTPVTESIGQ